ncbi:MAG: hypothetical protein C0490_28170, partial [Marivirga sp.]|nr:hypothetical protein [Marivirga sp.]
IVSTLLVFSIVQPSFSQALSDELKEYFKKSVLNKVKRLEHYITLIANKSMDDNLRKSSISQAVELFEDENRIVQISSLMNGKETIIDRPVRTYFDRLYAIKAEKVVITFYKVTQLTDVRLGPDNKYYATAYIFQDTKIYYKEANEVPDYTDVTEKAIDITIKPDTTIVGDKTVVLYPAKLGNINVKETRATQ